MSPNQIKLEI